VKDNEAKKICKVMTIDDKIKIVDKLRGGLCAAAVGLTITLMSCFNA
jgi:hypothetical protein